MRGCIRASVLEIGALVNGKALASNATAVAAADERFTVDPHCLLPLHASQALRSRDETIHAI